MAIVKGTYYIEEKLRSRIDRIFRQKYGTLRGGSNSRITKTGLIRSLLTAWCDREERSNATRQTDASRNS
jgi:hypothetical protein